MLKYLIGIAKKMQFFSCAGHMELVHRPAVIFIFTLACLSLTLPARAGTFSGANGITVAVPDGWEAEYEQDNFQILLTSPSEDCAVSVQALPTLGGQSAKEFSDIFAQSINGSKPEKMSGHDAYTFDDVLHGVPFTAFSLAAPSTIVVFMELGATESNGQALQTIRDSLRSNDRAVQKMLDVLK